jgi:hypothetical protein
MGADLYIKNIRDPIKAVWQPKMDEALALRDAAQDDVARTAAQKLVDEAYEHIWGGDGYFRDSYNGTSILGRLGLSWWRDLEYDVAYDKASGSYPGGNNISAEACKRFLDKVRAAGEPGVATESELQSRHCAVDDGENNVESWNKYFREKHTRLLAFLERAIENGGMYASC